VLRVEGLGMRFGNRWIFRGIGFELGDGQVLAVVGPNGCGKSTLLGIVAEIIPPTEGSVHLPSAPPRLGFGYASLSGELYADLTVAEHLELTADLRCCEARTVELLDLVGLGYAAAFPARTLSSGMRARLKLAIAVQGRPPLLVLDEPGAGLDGEGTAILAEVVRKQQEQGFVLLATNDEQERRLATHELSLR
jgi:ABC-type multidrug transport system ATPase subunit